MGFICLNESSLKIMINIFYFIFKSSFCTDAFDYAGKRPDTKAKENFKIHDVKIWTTNDDNNGIARYFEK